MKYLVKKYHNIFLQNKRFGGALTGLNLSDHPQIFYVKNFCPISFGGSFRTYHENCTFTCVSFFMCLFYHSPPFSVGLIYYGIISIFTPAQSRCLPFSRFLKPKWVVTNDHFWNIYLLSVLEWKIVCFQRKFSGRSSRKKQKSLHLHLPINFLKTSLTKQYQAKLVIVY